MKTRRKKMASTRYDGNPVKKYTNESETAVMDVIGFLCVSLSSNTVQLNDNLDSRGACACSETGFSSQNGDRLIGPPNIVY
jgi:hypothetical protein